MKRILYLMIFLFALNLLGGGILWYSYTILADKKVEERVLQEKISAIIEKKNKEIGLVRALAAVKGDRAELSKFLYDASEENQIQYTTRIEQLGATTGTTVDTLSLVLVKEAPPRLRGDFNMKGQWGNVYHFIRMLEEFPSHMVINRLNATYSTTDKAWSGAVQVDLSALKINK